MCVKQFPRGSGPERERSDLQWKQCDQWSWLGTDLRYAAAVSRRAFEVTQKEILTRNIQVLRHVGVGGQSLRAPAREQ